MICSRCLQTRRRSFFMNDVCDVCEPQNSMPPKQVGDFELSQIVIRAAMYHVLRFEERWIPEAEARDKGTQPSWVNFRRVYDDIKGEVQTDAVKALDWLYSLVTAPEEAVSDYECSLALLYRKVWVTEDEFPLAASAYHAWTKTQNAEVKPPPTGLFLATVGERLVVPGCQCNSIKALGVNPDYPERGERFLICFTAASGHDLKWFTGEGTVFDPQVGGTYDIKCTVSKHDEYQGHRSTLVSRCADNNAPPRKREKKE